MTEKLEHAFNIVIRYGYCSNCRHTLDKGDCHEHDCYVHGVGLIRDALEKAVESSNEVKDEYYY